LRRHVEKRLRPVAALGIWFGDCSSGIRSLAPARKVFWDGTERGTDSAALSVWLFDGSALPHSVRAVCWTLISSRRYAEKSFPTHDRLDGLGGPAHGCGCGRMSGRTSGSHAAVEPFARCRARLAFADRAARAASPRLADAVDWRM